MVTTATQGGHCDAWCPVHFTDFCGECEAPLHQMEETPMFDTLCVHPLGHTTDCPDAGRYLVGQGTSWPCAHCPGAGAINISDLNRNKSELRPWINYVATDAEDKLMHQLEHHEETNRCLRLQIENRSDLNHAKTTALRQEKRILEKKIASLQSELDRTFIKPNELSIISAALAAVKNKIVDADPRTWVNSRMEPASDEALRDMRYRIKQSEEVIARLDAELLATRKDLEDFGNTSEEQMNEQTSALVGQVRNIMTRITTPLDSPEILNELEKSITALRVLGDSQKVDNEKVRNQLESATKECRRLPATDDRTAHAIVQQRKMQLVNAIQGDTVKELVAKEVKLEMTNRLIDRDALFQPNLEVMGLQEHVDQLRGTKLDRAKRLDQAVALRDAMRKDLGAEIEMSDYSLAKRRLIYDEFVVTKHLLLGRMDIVHKLLASKEKELAKRDMEQKAFSKEFRRAYRIARFHLCLAESKLLIAQRELEAVKAERAALMTWPAPLEKPPQPQANPDEVGLYGISLTKKLHNVLNMRAKTKLHGATDVAAFSDVTTAFSDHTSDEPPTARTDRSAASRGPKVVPSAPKSRVPPAKPPVDVPSPGAASPSASSKVSEVATIFSTAVSSASSKTESDSDYTETAVSADSYDESSAEYDDDSSAESDDGSSTESDDAPDLEDDTIVYTKQRYKWLTAAGAKPAAFSDAAEVRNLAVALFSAGAPATDFIEPARACAFSPCYEYFQCTLTQAAAANYRCAPNMFVGVHAAMRPNERINLAKTYSTANISDGVRRVAFDALVRFMPICKGVVTIQGIARNGKGPTPQTLLLVENLRPQEDYRVLEVKLSPPLLSMHTKTQFPSAAAHKLVSDYFTAQTKLYTKSNFGQEGFAYENISNPSSSFSYMTSQYAAGPKRTTFIRSMPSHRILPHFFDLRYESEAKVEQIMDQVLEQMSDLVQAVRGLTVPQFMQGVSVGLCVGATNSELPVRVRLFNFEHAEIVLPSKWDAYIAEGFVSTEIKQHTRDAVWKDFVHALTRLYYNLCSYHNGRFMSPSWKVVRADMYSREWKPIAQGLFPIKEGEGAGEVVLYDGKKEFAKLTGSFTIGPTFHVISVVPVPPKYADFTLLLTFFENVADAYVEDPNARKQAQGRVTLRFTGYTQGTDVSDTIQLITQTLATRLRRTDCVSMAPFNLTTMPLDFPMRARPTTVSAYQKFVDRVMEIEGRMAALGRRYRIFVEGQDTKASLGLQVFLEKQKSKHGNDRVIVSDKMSTGLLSTFANPRKDDCLLSVNGLDRFEDMIPALKNLTDGVELIFARPKKRSKSK
eukprot:GEMP01005036.1.p1 GENE.GEMP01005036.1~~GEMP01005036.1.p1  ORF type:complete len:1312 (+),score=379.88 GEMP01005036.1:88-4023(+)